MVRRAFFISLAILWAPSVFAQSAKKIVWFHPMASFGYGSSSSAIDATKTVTGSTDFGATLGIRIKQKFLLGLGLDYRLVSQFSPYDASVGNRRGGAVTYASPLLGFEYKMISLKAMLHMMGKYTMSNATTAGDILSYQKAEGFRVDLLIAWKFKLKPVLFYESIKFSDQRLNGAATSVQVPVTLASFGLGFTFPF